LHRRKVVQHSGNDKLYSIFSRERPFLFAVLCGSIVAQIRTYYLFNKSAVLILYHSITVHLIMRLIFGALAGLALGQDKFLASAPPRELQPGGAMSCSGVDAINAPTSSSGTATSVNIDETTGRWSGTVSGVTLNSPSFTAKGAPCLGSVATTAVGNGLTYGALEAGFDGVTTPQLCMAEDTSQTTEAAISDSGGSPVTLAEFISEDLCRAFDNGALNYGLLMDECGGHANPYHYHFGHEKCQYTDTGVSATSSAGHSLILGYANDGAGYYGFFESADTLPTDLDACNGHTGKIPELGDTLVYHYHSTPYPPYTIGCYGPATMDECKDIYSSECANEDNKVVHSFALESPNDRSTIDHLLNADGALEYYRWCQCYDRPDWVNGKWANDHMGLVTAFYKHYRSIEETGGGPGETSGGTIGGSTGSTDSSSGGPPSGGPPSGSSSGGPPSDSSSGGPPSGGPPSGGDSSSDGLPSGGESGGPPSGGETSAPPTDSGAGDEDGVTGVSGALAVAVSFFLVLFLQ